MLRRRATTITHSASSAIGDFVVRHCPQLQHYRAPWFAPSGLLTTALSEMTSAPTLEAICGKASLNHEQLRLPRLARPEGASCCPAIVPPGLVSLDWLTQPEHSRAFVLLVPGLTGSAQSAFIRRAASVLYQASNHKDSLTALYNRCMQVDDTRISA